ncbi:MAG: flagellar basal body-associated FliL family protein [Amaricoccus sp.]|uniref:flagellar basal body-associated FliL family protein n=1 Tax=Amaricoccus sp. TaxID=1872485 RepID=UPI0039E2C8A6
MKKLIPLLIALLGLGTGVGAGMALKPAPEPVADACAAVSAAAAPAAHGTPASAHGAEGTAGAEGGKAAEGGAAAEAPCPPADPFAPETVAGEGEGGEHGGEKAEIAYVPIEKPFVVPIFAGDKTVAMVVMSLSIATEGEKAASELEAVQPRLRDSFLKVMFRHANSGGFDGSYTTGRKIEDLKSALLGAAREVVHDAPVDEVLITEIARQDS